MYLYECDASMNPTTLIAYKTGALRNSLTTTPAKTINKISISLNNIDTGFGFFIDDVYLNDLTPAMLLVKEKLLLPKNITIGDKLPTVGADNTKISYTSNNANVTIGADGTVTSIATGELATITATIVSENFADYKSVSGILPSVKKNFKIIVNQTPIAETTMIEDIVLSNAGGNDLTQFMDNTSVSGRVTLRNPQMINSDIVIATYKADGELQGVQLMSINDASGYIKEFSTPYITVNSETKTVKAYLWNNISGLVPLKDVVDLQRGGQ
jgi:hypothetical protein